MNRLPGLFVSHGTPTFAIEPGRAEADSAGPGAAPAPCGARGVAALDDARPVIDGGITQGVLAMDSVVFGTAPPTRTP